MLILPSRLFLLPALLLMLLPGLPCQAQTLGLAGQWFEVSSTWNYAGQTTLDKAGLVPVSQLNKTGGHYFYQADFDIGQEIQVLDFKNSTVIGQFHHRVFDSHGHLVAEADGGIQNETANPFFLRHGREIKLPSGHYRLITEVSSPFFLAQPAPYLDTLEHYRQAIKPGNALTLLCMGILLGLAFYYSSLTIIRRNAANALYVIFILGNLLYNGAALLVYEDLLGLHWFYLISLPILFSNCAYVFFVFRLLDITREAHPRLYQIGMILLGLFAAFIVLALLKPNWSLELDRTGVLLFISYGLAVGIVRARQGHPAARMYLVAVGTFFALGLLSISLSGLRGIHAIYVEHLGLLAVTVEGLLLAFVLAQQFAQLSREKEHALSLSQHNLHIASTDTLTGLPNRFVLENELQQLPVQGSLTFIDLDGLKYYNDRFGHERGDDLLRAFGRLLHKNLPQHAKLHRLGGDEFAVTCQLGNLGGVEAIISDTVKALRSEGFELAGASFGSALVQENPEKDELMRMADDRMYKNKNSRRGNANP